MADSHIEGSFTCLSSAIQFVGVVLVVAAGCWVLDNSLSWHEVMRSISRLQHPDLRALFFLPPSFKLPPNNFSSTPPSDLNHAQHSYICWELMPYPHQPDMYQSWNGTGECRAISVCKCSHLRSYLDHEADMTLGRDQRQDSHQHPRERRLRDTVRKQQDKRQHYGAAHYDLGLQRRFCKQNHWLIGPHLLKPTLQQTFSASRC